MRAPHRLVLVLTCMLFSGCNGITGPRACTLIGCYSGLEVVLDGTPTVPYRVEAEVPGQPGRFVFNCTDPGACGGHAFFAEFTPDQVRLHVITAFGTSTHVVQPKYEAHRPNGPECPPVCRTARVTVPLPAGVPA